MKWWDARCGRATLFGDDGSNALATLTELRTLYAFDFDGTLAPIVERPDDARLSTITVALLRRLAALAPTAIVTGRGLDDIRPRLGFAPLHLIGNHGAEGVPVDAADGGSAARDDDAAHRRIVTAWLAQWPAALGTDGVDPGIVLEPKRYSLSVHYRASDDQSDGAGRDRLGDRAPRSGAARDRRQVPSSISCPKARPTRDARCGRWSRTNAATRRSSSATT